jgi:DNA replication factor GINS
MLDRRTVKASLLKNEMRNAKRMLRELVQTRYRKLVRKIAAGDKVPSDLLTTEEERICASYSPIVTAYQNFAKNLLRGQLLKMDIAREHKTSALRFLKNVPEIIGADMRGYGPFKTEDIASLPIENAEILVKQGLAKEVEVT